MVNESEIPIFAGGLVLIGRVPNPLAHSVPTATKKQSSSFMKRLLANAKLSAKRNSTSHGKSKGKGRVPAKGRTRGIESDQKVHFRTLHKYY